LGFAFIQSEEQETQQVEQQQATQDYFHGDRKVELRLGKGCYVHCYNYITASSGSYPIAALFHPISNMKPSFLCSCFVALGLLVSCDKNESAPDVAPTHQVEVRYYGENLTGLGARVLAWRNTSTKTDSVLVVDLPVAGSLAATTAAAGRVAKDKVFRFQIECQNLRGASRPPVGGFLVASLVVDGQVRKSIRLDHTSSGNPIYPMAWNQLLPREW
jgi:hypothetical protein